MTHPKLKTNLKRRGICMKINSSFLLPWTTNIQQESYYKYKHGKHLAFTLNQQKLLQTARFPQSNACIQRTLTPHYYCRLCPMYEKWTRIFYIVCIFRVKIEWSSPTEHKACWGNQERFSGYLHSATQMSLVLGDPPCVWTLYVGISCQGSRLNLAFILTGYEERVLCPIIV